ncbi:MAG: hypothetical protein H7256_13655 [Bdellovibrio sp.]|nr:hypothetical protein [Bdellovibrio sp.]
MKKLILASVVLWSLTSRAEGVLEPLLGFMHDQNGIVFQVFSGGCTSKQSFTIENKVRNKTNLVSLVRTRPDYCKAFFFFGTYVEFSYEELGVNRGQSFEIQNSVVGSARPKF